MNLPPISLKAIAIAFAAELGVDFCLSMFVFGFFVGDELKPGMTDSEFEELARHVTQTTAYVPWMMLLGTATTVGGAYLAARLAKNIPYYHGLAMGIVGVVYILALWEAGGGAIQYFGLLSTIPLSILGAHFARKSISPDQ